jgi:uncharacterized membrane protein
MGLAEVELLPVPMVTKVCELLFNTNPKKTVMVNDIFNYLQILNTEITYFKYKDNIYLTFLKDFNKTKKPLRIRKRL